MFWSAFGVRYAPSASASTIDSILSRPWFQLEDLLDEEDVLQECKYMNPSLMEYLCRRDVMEKLIRYTILTQDVAGINDIPSKQKYAYMSSELFACENASMLETLFESPELLTLLFSFLDHKPPLDPSGVGYFRKVVVVLIQKKYDLLVAFLKTQKDVIGKMIHHIGLYSIMELLIMIGWDDGLGQINDIQWMYREGTIPKLVAKLDPAFEKLPEVHTNAARALVDVVVKCTPKKNALLVHHLLSPQTIEHLFRHMFSGSVSSLTNALCVATVLVQRSSNIIGGNSSDDLANEMAALAMEGEFNGEDLALPPVIQHALSHLPRFINVLVDPPNKTPLRTQFGVLKPPLGETRMKAVELFLVLFGSGYKKVNDELIHARAMNYILDLFFDYKWNNMLHTLVESIVQMVLESAPYYVEADEQYPLHPMKQALLYDAKLVERIITAERVEPHSQSGSSYTTFNPNGYYCIHHLDSRARRPGYMGHVLRIANALLIIQETNKDPVVANFLNNHSDWNVYVNRFLSPENVVHRTVLGGERPPVPGAESDDEMAEYNQQDQANAETSNQDHNAFTETGTMEHPNLQEDDDADGPGDGRAHEGDDDGDPDPTDTDAVQLADLMQDFSAEFDDEDQWDKGGQSPEGDHDHFDSTGATDDDGFAVHNAETNEEDDDREVWMRRNAEQDFAHEIETKRGDYGDEEEFVVYAAPARINGDDDDENVPPPPLPPMEDEEETEQKSPSKDTLDSLEAAISAAYNMSPPPTNGIASPQSTSSPSKSKKGPRKPKTLEETLTHRFGDSNASSSPSKSDQQPAVSVSTASANSGSTPEQKKPEESEPPAQSKTFNDTHFWRSAVVSMDELEDLE